MPCGKHKSGRFRKVFVKLSGGRTSLHYRKRKPRKAVCASCRKPLMGVPRELPSKMACLPKTKKRPERPFGGMYCSSCTRIILQQRARGEKK